jgi:hypothetical protein
MYQYPAFLLLLLAPPSLLSLCHAASIRCLLLPHPLLDGPLPFPSGIFNGQPILFFTLQYL